MSNFPVTARGRTYTVNEDGCWVWPQTYSNGYARICVEGKWVLAHRLVYEIFHGPIPEGMVIDESCDNKACVNPEHLRPMTQMQNVNRHFGRITHCRSGHEFTIKNTYVKKNGTRSCRRCHVRWETERKKRRRKP